MEKGRAAGVRDENADEYLDKIPMWTRKKNSLKDIRTFLEELGSPDDRMRIIHVAGTNGKGSVCAFLSSILGQAGYHTGVFVSPHLEDVRERFLIDGGMVSEDAFLHGFLRVRSLSEKMMERGYCHPSYFEFLFYMGMCIFSELNLDYVILETGIGGRLDITNVIRHPLVTVITSISYDHMQYLGDTIPKIASEKAGIIKEGVPVVYDCKNPQAEKVIEESARLKKAPGYPVLPGDIDIMEYGKNRLLCRYNLAEGEVLTAEIPSSAGYQAGNGLLAAKAAKIILDKQDGREKNRLPQEEIRLILIRGLSAMRWPARMEEVLPGFYLDGAHNDDGIREFVKTAARLCREEGKRAYVLFSSASDKEHGFMLRQLAAGLPLDGVVVTALESERGASLAMLLEEAGAAHIRVICRNSADEAVCELLSHQDEEHLLFGAGSLYLMGEVKKVLRRKKYDRF